MNCSRLVDMATKMMLPSNRRNQVLHFLVQFRSDMKNVMSKAATRKKEIKMKTGKLLYCYNKNSTSAFNYDCVLHFKYDAEFSDGLAN